MCKLCSPTIVLVPKLRIVQKSSQIFPLGMLIKHKHFEFGGGNAGDYEADGVRFKNLFKNKDIYVKIKNIQNIKIIIYIQKNNGSITTYNLDNNNKLIKILLDKNDIVHFGYIYDNISPPILDFKIVINDTM